MTADDTAMTGSPTGTERTSGVVRASSVMAIATLVSRFTGFVAKVVILAFLGFSVIKDSYELANTLPNIVFELLIGGVLTSVAIPLLSRARNDPDGGTRYTQQLMTLMVVGLTAATVLAVAGAPLLTRLYLSSGDNADLALATDLAYLLLPQIFFYGIAALFGAILNTGERFAAPAWAPMVNNLVVIVVGIVLLVTSGTQTGGLTSLTRGQLLVLGLGTTAGIVIQALIMLPALRRSGFRFGWRWGIDARMREAGALMAWAVAYALVSQVGYVVIVRIAKHTEDGFYGLFTYGSMLFQLPYGILGVSLLTAIMPRMSRHAASGDMAAVKRDMSLANRLSSVALLPITAAMIALAAPLAVVTARYGSVTDENARILALTLAGFAIGLLPLAITLVQMRVFYAMKDGRTPALINAIMVAVRIPLLLTCLALPTDWVVPGLALSMSLSYVVGVAVGEIWLHARFGQMGFGATLSLIGRAGLASAAGGLAAWLVATRLLGADAGSSLAGAIGQLVVGGAVGLIVVVAVMAALKIDEVTALWRVAQRKLGRNRGTMAATNSPAAAAGRTQPSSTAVAPDAVQRQGQEPVTEYDATPGPGAGMPAEGPAPETAPTAHPALTLSPGVIVGERYRLTRLIADDADGNQYWLARDTVLPRDMAVTILPGTAPTSSTVTRTLRAGRLHHPGLPQLLDMGSVGTASYVAGQWVDGATLGELLQAGPLEAAIAARMTAGIADALAEISRAGLALGAVHPSLVRVGMDGQVRLSHLVARATATSDDDVRATGALTYLMLTATWPLDPAEAPPGIRPAPRRGDSEIPASKVVLSASPELSRLAEAALHTTSGRGPSLDEIAERARGFGSGGAPRPGRFSRFGGGSGGSSAGSSGGPGLDNADTTPRASAERQPSVASQATPARLRTERRWKLSVAGVMLAALTALAIIMVSAVVKQSLANIVAPIEAAEHQELITQPPASTTRSVPATTSADGTTGASQTTSETAADHPVAISSATVYDPQGSPPVDYESYVDLAFDGDPNTVWPTWVYKQQFGPGGIKDGVGLMLTLSESVAPKSVTLTSGLDAGTVVEIRSADSPTAALDSTTVLGTATLGADPVAITLNSPPVSKNLIVWITKLADYQGDAAKNKGQYQSAIAEISVTG